MAAAVVGSASPVSSLRLPSPPPFPEVQIGPKSPGMQAVSAISMPENDSAIKSDRGPLRRIRPGTKAADFAAPPLIPLNELDSPFQLQEHLKALHYHQTRSPTDPKLSTPINRETALSIATPPSHVDRSLWLYELCRLLVQRANTVCVSFFGEEPPCSAATCPEMRASEWQYLCAVHEPPKSCCAIDYCCHTLEWAAETLTSTRLFPSRLTLGSEANGGSQGGVRQLTNIMRRVYRIFAHAWFQHRDVFWQVEGDEGLYMLFKTVCDVYSLIPEENYTIPPEAEGLAAKEENKGKSGATQRQDGSDEGSGEDTEDKIAVSTGATTRRHKQTPSLGSSVATIQEGDEDGGQESPAKMVETNTIGSTEHSTTHEPPLAKVSKAVETVDPVPPPTESIPTTGATEVKLESDLKPKEEESDEHGEPKEVNSMEEATPNPTSVAPNNATYSIKVEEEEKPEE